VKTPVALAAALAAIVSWSFDAEAAPCAADTLAGYVALGAGGCEIGSTSFQSFGVLEVPFGALEIDPADVLVTPLVDDPLRPGLSFVLAAAATANELLEVLVAYQVAAPLLRGAEVALDGSSVSGDGAVTAIEDVCIGGVFDPDGPTGCTGLDEALIAFDVGFDAEPSVTLLFEDASLLAVVKDIAVDGGLEGAASLAGVTNRFLVPEPATALLLAVGLAALGCRSRSPD
jgi:hypothetical protein